MLQDANLRKKSMRRTIDRVDLGLFGKPIKLHAWHRAKRSTWAGWAATGAVQALIGAVLYTLGALLFGAGLSPLTILFGIGFAVGCAIGDPISFLLWTFLFVELTGTISGVLTGAWFNLPSWWHVLAESWRQGQSVPPIFVGAVPVWMFVWILGGRGVAKGFDILVERGTLKLGFDVARRFMTEEEKLRVSAYEETGVSDIEAQRHFDVTDRDGTHAVIAGEEPRIFVEPAREEAPSSSSSGYQSYLEDDEDLNSALSRRAAAGVRMSDGEGAAARTSVDLGKVDAVSLGKESSTTPSFMMETNLPAPPVDEAAVPVQRAETPKFDTRTNRALQRHMAQLVLSFEMVMTDDELEAFVSNHREVLMNLSDDQVRLLDTMDGGQALIAVARQIQSDNATSFIAGISDGPSEDLSLLISEPAPLPAAPIDMSSAPAARPQETVAEEPREPEPEAEAEQARPASNATNDVLALAGALDAFLPDRRGSRPVAFKGPSYDDLQGAPPAEPMPSETPGEHREPESGATSDDEAAQPDPEPRPPVDMTDSSAEAGEGVENRGRDASRAVAPIEEDAAGGEAADVCATDDDAESGAAMPEADQRRPDDVPPVAAESEAAAPGAASEEDGGAAAGDAPTSEGGSPFVDAGAAQSENHPSEEDAPRRSSLAEGEFGFDVDDEVIEDRPSGEEAQEGSEIEMSSYSRDEVLLVRGLLAANASAQDKAQNVHDFQDAHPQLVVADVVASRSFVEFLGDHDAASVRHSWREVQAIIATPPSERLGREFDRVNQRGQKFIEEPHLLDRPLYNHWEQESFRLRGAAAAAPDLLHSLGQHISINVSLGDAMRELLDKRDTAPSDSERSMDSMPIVSQKVPKREDALRGRSVLSSMFRPGAPREELPMKDARRPTTLAGGGAEAAAHAPDPVVDAEPEMASEPAASTDLSSTDSLSGDDMSSDRGPHLGEEGFVSKHPVGSADYRREMNAHQFEMDLKREQREAKEREEAEERDRQAERRREQEEAENASQERIRRQNEEAARLEAEEKVRKAAAEADGAEAEAERAREAARLAAAETLLAESRAAAEAEVRSRTEVETMFLAAAKRAHGILFQIPKRFHTPEVLGAFISFEEISAYRKGLTLVAKPSSGGSDPLKRNDTVGRARADSAQRAQVQYEVIVGEAAKAVLARIRTIVGAADGQDLMDLLEDQEKLSVARIQNAVDAGEKAVATLAEVERQDRELERLAEGSRGMDDLQSRLRDAESRVGVLFDEKQTFEERIAQANRERDEAVAEVARMRREMMGEVDDEFQRVLEEHATHIDDIGVGGFYKYVSPDKRGCFVIITAKSSSFPDGTVDVGDHSVSVSDIVDFAVDKAKTFRAKPEILFIDNGMRPHLSGRGLQIQRDASILRNTLNIAE